SWPAPGSRRGRDHVALDALLVGVIVSADAESRVGGARTTRGVTVQAEGGAGAALPRVLAGGDSRGMPVAAGHGGVGAGVDPEAGLAVLRELGARPRVGVALGAVVAEAEPGVIDPGGGRPLQVDRVAFDAGHGVARKAVVADVGMALDTGNEG